MIPVCLGFGGKLGRRVPPESQPLACWVFLGGGVPWLRLTHQSGKTPWTAWTRAALSEQSTKQPICHTSPKWRYTEGPKKMYSHFNRSSVAQLYATHIRFTGHSCDLCRWTILLPVSWHTTSPPLRRESLYQWHSAMTLAKTQRCCWISSTFHVYTFFGPLLYIFIYWNEQIQVHTVMYTHQARL